MKFRVPILLIFIINFCLQNKLIYSYIVESNSIEIINKYVDNESWVFFDLDNTVFEPINEHEASQQWFNAKIKKFIRTGINKEEALKLVVQEFKSIQKYAKVKPVESSVVTLIKDLQQRKIPVFAITSRSCELAQTTQNQLQSININLSIIPLTLESCTFDLSDQCKFCNGIIFCEGNSKGETLKKFIEKINIYPKKILLIDDIEFHLQDIEKAIQTIDKNIETISIRYSYLDNKVKSFVLKD